MNSNVEKLLLEKDFEALTGEEQAFVSQHLDEQEYRRMRLICQTAPQTDAGQLPPARLREQLMQKMAQQRPVPTTGGLSWWVGAALLLAGSLAGWFLKPVQVRELRQEPVVIRQVDTVYQVKTVIKAQIRWKERVVYLAPTPPLANTPVRVEQPEFIVPELHTPTVKGTSLGDTPELMKFFTDGK